MTRTWRRAGLFALLLLPFGVACSTGAGDDPGLLGHERSTLTLVGTELVGRPTSSSAAVHALANAAAEAYVEYGTVSGVYTGSTIPGTFTSGTISITVTGLDANTRYYYR